MKKILLLLALGVALTTQTLFAQVPSYVPTTGLVGYWPFNGNANDISGNNNNGTNNGATLTSDRFGNVNSAYNFDGINDFIQLQCPTLNNSITISLWAYDEGGYPNNNSINPRYISAESCNGGFALINNVYDTPTGLFFSRNRGVFSTALFSNVSPSYNIQQHIVFTYDGSIGKYYLNGNLVSTVNNIGAISLTSNLYFGKGGCSSLGQMVDAFKGKLDDIGIWDRALSQEEITNLYNVNQCITNITVTDTLIINVGQLSFNDPVAWANNITIAPNPASSQININFNNITNLNGGTLKIINSLGQEVATTPITTSGTNSTMQLATWGGTGMYFVQIINPQGQIVDIKKIILQ
jgi:hypothetical protein